MRCQAPDPAESGTRVASRFRTHAHLSASMNASQAVVVRKHRSERGHGRHARTCTSGCTDHSRCTYYRLYILRSRLATEQSVPPQTPAKGHFQFCDFHIATQACSSNVQCGKSTAPIDWHWPLRTTYRLAPTLRLSETSTIFDRRWNS